MSTRLGDPDSGNRGRPKRPSDCRVTTIMSLPTVALGTEGLSTTSLGIGCAGLFRASSPGQREALLHTAYDVGIRHFDVAPMYGFGLAEPELGAFVRGRR